jgi:hypothetical protein
MDNSIDLISEIAAANLLGVSNRTMQTWRYRGTGPIYISIGRRCIRYRMADLNEYLEKIISKM